MRTIKFKLYLQHDETGRITTKTFSYAEIFSSEAIKELETTYLRWSVIGKSQFTGLLDKNGKEIYGEDIVNIHWRDEETDIDDVITKVYYDDEHCGWCLSGNGRFEKLHKTMEWRLKLLGNIYESPELLKNATN
jgi:uncharacterized phage protein (TIGR01671 family)